jgi:hypothetical protein
MITNIVIEVVIALVVLFVSNSFWQLVKRDRFLKNLIRFSPFLEELISKGSLNDPNPKFTVFAEKNQLGYAINVSCAIESDRKTIKRLEITFGLVGLIATIGSYALGPIFFIINCVLFILPVFAPVAQSAQRSAIDHIMEMAVILYRWRSDNPTECDNFISKASSLQSLYDAIKKVY